MTLGVDNTIRFKEDTHQYFDSGQREYKSVTRILKALQEPFDSAGVSAMMAKGIAKEKGISIEQAQKELLKEWDAKRDSAGDRGNFIHGGLEKYLIDGTKTPGLEAPINIVRDLVKPFYRFYPEVILYDQESGVAGQTDLVVQRQKSQNSLYDFYDYKTNESKGIQFDSVNRKAEPLKHYNRMLMAPLDHIEDCNYNIYSLQLSLYAALAEMTYGIRVGRLAIIFINNEMQTTIYPVGYLKLEALKLLEHTRTLRPLPPMAIMPEYKKADPIPQYTDDW